MGSGLVVIDKPAGLTSHDVVARVRRLAGTRKVGHAGTLDPMATGVLLLGVNRATRLLGHLALADKKYAATVRLGAATTTDDAEGEVLSTAPVAGLTEPAVRFAFAALVGDLQQVPSAVSAIKVNGERAYRRVRAGEDVDLPSRPVTIHSLSVVAVRPGAEHVDVDIAVHCSTGTYVRALARDVGAALGVGGHLVALRRTAVGGVTLAEAILLADAQAAGAVSLLCMEDTARRFFPVVTLDEGSARDVSVGRGLDAGLFPAGAEGPVAVLGPDGSFLALYRADGRPVAVFV